eukprot:6397995-Amphidinium_carterae.1
MGYQHRTSSSCARGGEQGNVELLLPNLLTCSQQCQGVVVAWSFIVHFEQLAKDSLCVAVRLATLQTDEQRARLKIARKKCRQGCTAAVVLKADG